MPEDCRHLTYEIGQETPLELLYLDMGNYRHSRRQLMQLQQLAVWREKMVKALNYPRSFILKSSTMIDLVEKIRVIIFSCVILKIFVKILCVIMVKQF